MVVKRKLSFKRNEGRRRRTVPPRRRRVARRRRAVSRNMRRTIRNVAITAGETKYTAFRQVNTTFYEVAGGVNSIVWPLTQAVAAIFPAQGDSKNGRDGEKYLMLGLNVFLTFESARGNVNMPLHMYLVRAPARHVVTPGSISTSTLFPQSKSSDLGTWPTLPIKVGGLENGYGKIIRSFKFYPSKKIIPESGKYHQSTAADDLVTVEQDRSFKFFIPIRKRVTCSGSAAEIPWTLSKYYLIFHCQNATNTTVWNLKYLYTQCVFKDY